MQLRPKRVRFHIFSNSQRVYEQYMRKAARHILYLAAQICVIRLRLQRDKCVNHIDIRSTICAYIAIYCNDSSKNPN